MKRCVIVLVLASLHGSLFAQPASHVVISEFATRGPGSCNAACEFVELYNPTPIDVDISGWKLQYRAAAGSTYSTLVTLPAGAVIRSRGYFLVTPSSWTGSPSADAMWPGSGLADNGNIRLVDAANVTVDRVGYGTGNDPERSPAPNHGEQANNNSVERKASASSTAESMGPGGSEERAGNGYDTDDNAADFVVRSTGREPQNTSSPFEPSTDDGSGSAVTPISSARAGETLDVPVVITPEKGKPPAGLCLVVPPGVEWSRSGTDVVLGPTLTASVRVGGDSVFLDHVVFTADSATVTLLSQRMPVMTGTVVYTVLSRSEGGVFLPLRVQPSFLVIGAPMPISQARENDAQGIPVRLNQYVTVRGIITAAAEFGAPAYMEDETGGLAVYDFSFVDSVRVGDEVTVTGKVAQYAGLTELTDAVIDERVPGAGLVHPLVLTISDILADGVGGMERYEGRLVRLNAVTVNTTSWAVMGSGTNYRLKDVSGEMDIRIDKDVDLAGAPAPGGSFDVVGIVSQYRQNPPFVGGYQLMPRHRGDIIVSGPRIVTVPVEEDITHDGVTIRWETGSEAVSSVWYGERPDSLPALASAPGAGLTHRVRLDGLRPATIYWVRPFSVGGGDTSFAQPFPVITASAGSKGTMNVYFNLDVDPGVYPPLPAAGNVSLKDKLLDRIDSARFSIDLALYSFSGQTAEDIAASLLAASRRGVRIRAIFESDNANSPAVRTLRASVPVILDSFDSVNAGTGLLHDKFVIIDARDRTSDTDDWVVTGSWNLTDQGTLNDAQNVVEIQDQALATVFTAEFEEMWGSSGDTPVSGTSRFGARKRDDTPHRVNVAGTLVDVYFSPSDRTTDYLRRTAASAGTSAYFCILTFTRDDLANAFIDLARAGKTVRGVFDNDTDQGTEYPALRAAGVDVLLKKNISGLLHHKYLIVDADARDASTSAVVVTGSHNWSNAAEFWNNENTVGIHSVGIARQYLQEWYRRYRDAGGTAVLVLGTGRLEATARSVTPVVYPNPVSAGGVIAIHYSIQNRGETELAVSDLLGRTVIGPVAGSPEPGMYETSIGLGGLPAGVYLCRVTTSGGDRRFVPFIVR